MFNNLLLLRATSFKGRARLWLVFDQPRQQTFPKAVTENNRAFEPAWIAAQHGESPSRRSRVPFTQRAGEPAVGGASNSGRSLRKNCINHLVERLSVSFPAEIQSRPLDAGLDVVGHDAERAIERSDGLAITPQVLISKRNLLESVKVAWVKLRRALQVAYPCFLIATPAQNVAG